MARVVRGETESSPTRSLRCGTVLARHISATPFSAWRFTEGPEAFGAFGPDSLGGRDPLGLPPSHFHPRCTDGSVCGYFRVPLCSCLLTLNGERTRSKLLSSRRISGDFRHAGEPAKTARGCHSAPSSSHPPGGSGCSIVARGTEC